MQQLDFDKVGYFTDGIKKKPTIVDAAARDGSRIRGMYSEGGRWNVGELFFSGGMVSTL